MTQRTFVATSAAPWVLPLFTRTLLFALACAGCSSGSPLKCEKSLASACSFGGLKCIADWATAEKPATWCGTGARTSIATNCSGFAAIQQSGFDTSITYFYRDSTLVGISTWANTDSACIGGESGLELPDTAACSFTQLCPISDAGSAVDGGGE